MKLFKEKKNRLLKTNQIISQVLSNIIKETKITLFHKQIFSDKTKSVRNICQYSGRTRWVIFSLKVSRHNFRYFIDRGLLDGFRRSSW